MFLVSILSFQWVVDKLATSVHEMPLAIPAEKDMQSSDKKISPKLKAENLEQCYVVVMNDL